MSLHHSELYWRNSVTPSTAAKLLGVDRAEFDAMVDRGDVPVRFKPTGYGVVHYSLRRRIELDALAQVMGAKAIIAKPHSKYEIVR